MYSIPDSLPVPRFAKHNPCKAVAQHEPKTYVEYLDRCLRHPALIRVMARVMLSLVTVGYGKAK